VDAPGIPAVDILVFGAQVSGQTSVSGGVGAGTDLHKLAPGAHRERRLWVISELLDGSNYRYNKASGDGGRPSPGVLARRRAS